MNDSPPKTKSIFEAARLGWNVRLTCWKCGHVRVLHAAALWLKLSMKGCPDHLQEVTRHARCLPCDTERRMIIRCPKLELTRDPPTGDLLPLPLPLPTEAAVEGRDEVAAAVKAINSGSLKTILFSF